MKRRLACLLLALACADAKAQASPPRGRALVCLDDASWSALVRGGSESVFGALSLECGEGGAELAAGLRLGPEPGARDEGDAAEASVSLVAGPGRFSGSMRFLADPLSWSSQPIQGSAFSLDQSLSSASSLLGFRYQARACTVSAFAAGLGLSPGLLVKTRAEEFPGPEPEPTQAAAGLSVELPGAKGAWAAAAASVLRGERSGQERWELQSPAVPAGLVLVGSLAREWRPQWGLARFGLAASAGRQDGAGLAARLEASAKAGPVLLRVSAAESGPGFRDLSGSPPERSLAAALDLRIALRLASALVASLRLESPRPKPGDRPGLGGSARLGLSLPTGGLILTPRLLFERGAESGPSGELGLGLDAMRDGRGNRLDLGCRFGGQADSSGLRIALCSRNAAELAEGELGLGLELGLSLLEDWRTESPVEAKAQLELSVGLPEGAELRLAAELPGEGLVLEPLDPDEAFGPWSLSLRYLSEL